MCVEHNCSTHLCVVLACCLIRLSAVALGLGSLRAKPRACHCPLSARRVARRALLAVGPGRGRGLVLCGCVCMCVCVLCLCVFVCLCRCLVFVYPHVTPSRWALVLLRALSYRLESYRLYIFIAAVSSIPFIFLMLRLFVDRLLWPSALRWYFSFGGGIPSIPSTGLCIRRALAAM